MAIAFDAGSQGSAFASSVTFSHTVGSGANRLLVVFVESPTSDSSRVSSVTYNGTGLTLYNGGPFGASGTYIWAYYMVAPPTGSANVVVTCNAGGDVGAIASSWTGVNQSTPISGNVSAASSGSSPRSDSVTLSAGEMAVDAFGWASGTTGTPAGSQTQIGTVVPQGLYFVASYLSGASAMGWSWDGGFSGFVHLILRLSATADTTPPTTPTGLSVTGSTATSITIGWSASTDDTAVTGYDVEVADGAGSVLTTVNLGNVLTYTLSGLSAGTVRKFRVRAHDAVPNNSSYSSQVTGTALDASAPTTPSGLAVSASTTTSITWTWSAATDNVAVTGYRIRRRDAANAIIDTVDLGNVLTYTWTGLSATNQRGLEVAAFDAAGNVSAFSSVVTGTASASGDTSPPTVPASLAVIATSSTSITWGWSASTDVGGGVVAGYRIQRLNSDDSVIDTVDIGTITQYQWTGLTGSTTKKIKVAAFDNAGTPNVSSYSSAVSGTTAVAAAQLYARITLNRPATLSDPGYPPVAVTMPGMVYKGWPGDAGFSLATGVKVTFTVGNLNEIAAPMPLTWGDGTTVASGDAGFAFATNWNGTVTIVNATHGQIGSRFTVGA